MQQAPDNPAASRPDEPAPCPDECRGRRRFCQVAIGGTAAVSAATLAYPFAAFLRLPKSSGPVQRMEVPLEDIQEGYSVWGEHRGRQIVVIKLNGEIRAFDGTCPHLGCIVRWDGSSRRFECPCHAARFDDLGNPIGGPVNTPLRRMAYVVEDNVLKIRRSGGHA